MQKTPFILAASAAATFALLGCQQKQPEVVQTNVDPQAEALKTAPPVELPPAIKAAKTYRCKDNSLVYVSFLTDDVTALARDKQEEPPVATLKAPAAGQAFVGQGETGKGFALSGSGDTVTYTSPDSGTQTCKA
ncbi:MAG TPA: hypothetical protein VF631_12975 [Allosphingosinicella sp.]|jgi:hypothetical protein|uniref:hypothetical protein n=1 Tax=Allosphingosinicella sp. TaxID=2823234 RepID=UPI002F28253A